MRPATSTPDTIAQARERMTTAAGLFDAAVKELRAAQALVRTTDEWEATQSAELDKPKAPLCEHLTLAFWLDLSIRSVLEDAPPEDAAEWVRADVRDGESSMRGFVATDRKAYANAKKKRAA